MSYREEIETAKLLIEEGFIRSINKAAGLLREKDRELYARIEGRINIILGEAETLLKDVDEIIELVNKVRPKGKGKAHRGEKQRRQKTPGRLKKASEFFDKYFD